MAVKTPTATEAVLGQLVVRLVGDAGSLLKSVKEGEKSLRTFVSRAQANFKAIAKAGAIAVGAVTGIAFAVQRMAAQATQIKSLSQSLGVTTEQLTSLQFAAAQAGVPVEALTGSTTRLNQAISQVAQGIQGPASLAFEKLGISVRDAAGNMRPTIEVFHDLADRFASFEDGAKKSALAAQLFGEQGVKLLPVLNQGSDGLKKLAEQAKAAGVVLDTETIEKAAEADRKFKLLGNAFQSAGIKLSAEFLPAVESLSRLVQDEKFAAGIGWVADKINWLAESLGRFNRASTGDIIEDFKRSLLRPELEGRLKDLQESLSMIHEARRNAFEKGMDTTAIDKSLRQLQIDIVNVEAALRTANGELFKFQELRAVGEEGSGKTQAPTIDPEELTRQQREISLWVEDSQFALNELLSTPIETMATKIDAITDALNSGVIGLNEYRTMMKRVNDEGQQHLDDLLSTSSQTLTALFQENKTAATASSLINTYQGITKALSAYPPPYNMAMAAMVAAQGFAQVRAIRSTSKSGGGGGGAASVSSGSSAAAARGSAGDGGATGGGGPNGPRSVYVYGLDPNQLFTGKQFRALVDQLLQYQRDGGHVLIKGT